MSSFRPFRPCTEKHTHTSWHTYIYIYIYICVCVYIKARPTPRRICGNESLLAELFHPMRCNRGRACSRRCTGNIERLWVFRVWRGSGGGMCMRTLRWSSSVWPPHSRPAGSAVNVGGGEERGEEDSNQGNLAWLESISLWLIHLLRIVWMGTA